jgi:hypothetical protein
MNNESFTDSRRATVHESGSFSTENVLLRAYFN